VVRLGAICRRFETDINLRTPASTTATATSTSTATGGVICKREGLSWGVDGKFVAGPKALFLLPDLEVGDVHPSPSVRPAPFIAISPGHFCPHPARIEIEPQWVRANFKDRGVG